MKKIEVIMRTQRVVAYDGTRRVFEFDCVLGDDKTPTRSGHFSVRRKDRHHVSGQSGHPMPYSLFFDEGRAIHAATNVTVRHFLMRVGLGKLDNITPEAAKIGSHGCVNLKADDAARLYDWAQIGTPVVVQQ